MKQHALTHKNRDMKNSPSRSSSNPNSDCDQPKTPNPIRKPHDDSSNDRFELPINSLNSLKRSPPDEEIEPLSKRLQHGGKYLCYETPFILLNFTFFVEFNSLLICNFFCHLCAQDSNKHVVVA